MYYNIILWQKIKERWELFWYGPPHPKGRRASRLERFLDTKQSSTGKTGWKVLYFLFKSNGGRQLFYHNVGESGMENLNIDPEKNWIPYEEGNKITFKEHHKKFHWIHFVVKNKVMIPFLWFIHSFLRKYLVKEINDEAHNRWLKIFNEAWEDSLTHWNLFHLRAHKVDKRSMKWWRERKENHDSSQHLRLLKEIIMTMAWYDSAYREWLTFLVIDIANKVDEHADGKKIHHLLNINQGIPQVQYYKMYKRVMELDGMKKQKVRIEPVYDKPKKEKENEKHMKILDKMDENEFRKEIEAKKSQEGQQKCLFPRCIGNVIKESKYCREHGGLRK